MRRRCPAAVRRGVAQLAEPLERGLFDDAFGEMRHFTFAGFSLSSIQAAGLLSM